MNQLDTLQAFCRLVEMGTFSAAAAALHVRQSTVSKWIQGLEADLEVQLVDRTTRSMRVTEAGQRFYHRAVVLLADYEAAVEEVRTDNASLSGRIRLSVPVVFGQRFVVPAVADFLLDHPRIELELVFADRYVRLVEEAFDAAVRVGVPEDSTLRSHILGEGRRRLVASPTYLAARGTPRRPSELVDHQCLVHTTLGMHTSWSFTRGTQTQNVRVGGRLSANHSEATLHMAKAGLGVAMLSHWLVDDALARGTLVPILKGYRLAPAPIRALTPPGRLVAPRVRALITHLRQSLKASL